MQDRQNSEYPAHLADSFYTDLTLQVEEYQNRFLRLLSDMSTEELLAFTQCSIPMARVRVIAVLRFAGRLFRLNQHLPFETASSLCKAFLKSADYDLGNSAKITFSEYLYYVSKYATPITLCLPPPPIPDTYAPGTSLGRTIGGHMGLDIVFISLCQANARRLAQPDWRGRRPDMPSLHTLLRLLARHQLLRPEDVAQGLEHIMLDATQYALDTVRDAACCHTRD